MRTAIWWIRRDLRLSDNQALSVAISQAEQVVPVFVLDPVLWRSPYVGDKRLAFLLGGLRSLDADLKSRGSYLVLRKDDPVPVLRALCHETGAEVIFAEADVSPYARERDARVSAVLPLQRVGGLLAHPPGTVLKKNGEPYTVYTPFKRTWRSLPLPQVDDLLPAPDWIKTPADLASLPILDHPALPACVLFVPGEGVAQQRLRAFLAEDVVQYAEDRDRMDLEGTSRLSPYLRFGMLSLQQALVAVLAACDACKGAEAWLNELIWREFYMHILYHFPDVRRESFRESLREIAWENDPDAFAAWQEGRTGYPVVDAAMRQMLATGWMHNRARMVVASFLTKDLLIDWRWGERYFMQHLIDGDPASNNGGWQWSAGTGTDAAPYFRIFNPILQGKKFDPQGAYIRRWVPELNKVPDRYIHRPWTMPPEEQKAAHCVIGHAYPSPIVDHAWARERTLAAYKQAKLS